MERIYKAIQAYHMIEPGMKVLAGVSGGADSVCLLAALADLRSQMKFSLAAVHVEHGIRGEESLQDAEFTARLCETLGVPLVTEQIDAGKIARELGISVEEAGRTARYEIFERTADELGCERIAVAHNRNDQAETVIWNLARGSGLTGLGGIRPVRDRIIRPLLFLERSEIEDILMKRGLSWRTDRTNLETDYTRNRIRLELLPLMQRELNTHTVAHIARAASDLQEVQQYLDIQTDQAAAGCLHIPPGKKEVILMLDSFSMEPELIQKELLRRCLREFGAGTGLKNVGAVHIEALLRLCSGNGGNFCSLPGRILAVKDGNRVRFLPNGEKEQSKKRKTGEERKTSADPEEEISLIPDRTLRFGTYRASVSVIENSPSLRSEIEKENQYTKWLSYDTITSNVCFRKRRPGDYLVVNRQGGKKKLKDYLIDQKIPRLSRDRIWVLADGSRILWVIGLRISEDAKVGQNTKKIWKITIEEEQQ